MTSIEFQQTIAGYSDITVDLGTGDGRFVRHMASKNPKGFFLGVDACRDNLAANSRKAPGNAMFIVANALDLPDELMGVANNLTINFPWGSLLTGLLAGDPGLLGGIMRITQPSASLEVKLNGGALAEAGWSIDQGTQRALSILKTIGFTMGKLQSADITELRAIPTTWAKRIAFGRDPQTRILMGKRQFA